MRRTGAVAFVVWAAASAAAAQVPGVPADASITLERTRCFGTCSAYSVTIDAAGNVAYEGKDFVRVKGRQTDRIPASHVRALLDTAERIGFFDLRDHYRTIRNADGSETMVTDMPTTFVTVKRSGRSKRVEDYLGAPKPLREFEREIDEAGHTQRWIRIDAATLQEWAREGRVIPADAGAELLRKALEYDEVDVVKQLIAMGADPNGVGRQRHSSPLMMARSAAAARALLDAGADPSARNSDGYTVLQHATYLGPELAEVLVKAGAPVNGPADRDGRTALWLAACGGNAGVVDVLLAAGADPSVVASNSLSAIECARRSRENARASRTAFAFDTPPPFVPDYDRTIALLAQAIAQRKKR